MKDRELVESLLELQRYFSSLKELESEASRYELANMAQVRITRELVKGKRTVSELVEAIWGARRGDPEFKTQYSRIQKEMTELESMGFVTRRLFGRDKPYSLTRLAVERLTKTQGPGAKILPTLDLVVYSTVLALGGLSAAMILLGTRTPSHLLVVGFAFIFLGGVGFSRLAQAIGRLLPFHVPEYIPGVKDEKLEGGDIVRRKGEETEYREAKERGKRHTPMSVKLVVIAAIFWSSFLVLSGILGLGLHERIGLTPREGPGEEPLSLPNTQIGNYFVDERYVCLVTESGEIEVSHEIFVYCFEGFVDRIGITLPYGPEEITLDATQQQEMELYRTEERTGVAVTLPKHLYGSHGLYAGDSNTVTLRYTLHDLPGEEGILRKDKTVVFSTSVFGTHEWGARRNLTVRIVLPPAHKAKSWEPTPEAEDIHIEKSGDPDTGRVAVSWVFGGNLGVLGSEPFEFGVLSSRSFQ